MNKSISLTVNAKRFVERILGKLFEHPARAFSEAMQNSRRAGATEIRFLVTPDPDDCSKSVVHIADDGSGILDWGKLLSVAESGWDDAVVEKEDAFGIGFAALLFSCRELVVRSRGHELSLNQADAVKGVRFALLESKLAPRTGTVIRLEGCKLDAGAATAKVREYAAGFPLPVFLGDEELPAPNRLDHAFVDLAVGKVRFTCFGADGTYPCHTVCAYYQGLPISIPVGKRYDSREPHIIVHVDEARFPATAPDRAGLCDPDRFHKAFVEATRRHWENALHEIFKTLTPAEFVERYWSLAKKFGCADLLDRCPVLPSCALSEVDGFAYRRESGDSNYVACDRSVSREEAETGRVTLVQPPSEEDSDDAFALLTLAHHLKWVFVEDLPLEHWASKHVVSIDDCETIAGQAGNALAVDVSYAPTQTFEFFRAWVSPTVCLVDRYAISLKKPTGCIRYSVEVDACGLYRDGVLIVPAKESGSMLVRQISSYLDESEHYLEDLYERDDEGLQDLIAEWRGRPAAATIKNVLSSDCVAAKPGIAGTVSLLIFGQPAERFGCAAVTHVIELSESAIATWMARFPQEAAPLNEIRSTLGPLARVLTAPALDKTG
jgi:hypothetical protein